MLDINIIIPPLVEDIVRLEPQYPEIVPEFSGVHRAEQDGVSAYLLAAPEQGAVEDLPAVRADGLHFLDKLLYRHTSSHTAFLTLP